ncbi:MAG: ABC transporter ATP-binding protein [Planctomycetales bacterium]
MILRLENVDKTYRGRTGEVHALREFSLSLDEGEFVAVQGPSGSGKSTLLLLAGALMAPDSGKIEIAGQDPQALSSEDRAKFRAQHIGFVFQQFHLVPYLNVLDNVLTPSLAADIPDAASRAAELLDRFGMTPRKHHVPSELSTGERQRTALARALLNRPKLLLADEPTGNLDRENADVVLRCLGEFAQDGGGVLLVTHDPQAAEHASRKIFLETGELRLSGKSNQEAPAQ